MAPTSAPAPTPSFINNTLASDVRTYHQFSNPTWLENIVALPNGSILVSVIGRAEVHMVKPSADCNTASTVVGSFPNANAVLGITELIDGTIAVAAGNMTPKNEPINGSFAIWRIDLSQDKPTTEKIGDLPHVNGVNGIAALNDHTILLADSWNGNIVAFDTKTNVSEVVLEHSTLHPNYTEPLPIGVNGLKIHDGYAYYSNTVQNLIGRVQISDTGKATGPFTTIASGPTLSVPDDFAVAKDGSVYVGGPLAAPKGDTLQRITLDGKTQTIVVGGPVAGSTSAAFGRTKRDQNIIYLSTMGGFGANGTIQAGGRIAAVTLL